MGWFPMPKRLAERWFAPDYRLIGRDKPLERVRTVRSWLGLGVLVWIAATYGGADDAAEGWVTAFVASVFVAIIACPISVAVMVAVTRSEFRADTRRSLMLPLRSLGLFVLVSVITLGGSTALAYGSKGVGTSDPLSFLVTVIGLIVVGWALRFWFLAVRLIPRHLFRAVDGHPLLPAVIAPWLAWTAALIDAADDGGGKGAIPQNVRLIGTLGGPVTITVLALWEAIRVRRRYGVTFRGGPHPTRVPQPAVPPQLPHQSGPYGAYGQNPQAPHGDPRQHPAWRQPPPPPWG